MYNGIIHIAKASPGLVLGLASFICKRKHAMKISYTKSDLAKALSRKLGKEISNTSIQKALGTQYGCNCWIDGERYHLSFAEIEAGIKKNLFEALKAVKDSGQCNMADRQEVLIQLRELKFYQAELSISNMENTAYTDLITNQFSQYLEKNG